MGEGDIDDIVAYYNLSDDNETLVYADIYAKRPDIEASNT
jgi:hypothetical protein